MTCLKERAVMRSKAAASPGAFPAGTGRVGPAQGEAGFSRARQYGIVSENMEVSS